MLAHDEFGAFSLARLDRAQDAAMMILRDGEKNACLRQIGLHGDEGRGGGERKRHCACDLP